MFWPCLCFWPRLGIKLANGSARLTSRSPCYNNDVDNYIFDKSMIFTFIIIYIDRQVDSSSIYSSVSHIVPCLYNFKVFYIFPLYISTETHSVCKARVSLQILIKCRASMHCTVHHFKCEHLSRAHTNKGIWILVQLSTCFSNSNVSYETACR